MKISLIPLLLLACILPIGCASKAPSTTAKGPASPQPQKTATFTLQSPAFSNNKELPSRFACGGVSVSPPLSLAHLPKSAQTVAFVLEDPDAPNGTYTHWIMWNWPISETEIPDALPAKGKLDSGAIQGTGSNGKVGYNPPCPPNGTHRYYFKAYALDTKLSLPSSSNKQALLAAMQGHIVGQGILMATYHK